MGNGLRPRKKPSGVRTRPGRRFLRRQTRGLILPRFRRRAKGFWDSYGTISQVLIVYAMCLFSLLWLYLELNGSTALDSFLAWNAQATGFLAGVFGSQIDVQGNVVRTTGFSMHIVDECTSLAALAIFLSGVIALPASLAHKLWGILLGVVVLSAVNVLRTTSLLYIGIFFPSALDIAHILVWQSLMIVLAVVLWIVWWRGGRYGERVQS